MMNWIGFGRKPSWPNFKVLSRHSPGGTEVNHEHLSHIGRQIDHSGLRSIDCGFLDCDAV
jgi:hypothetical protein